MPALVIQLRFDQKEAVVTPLGALLLPVGLGLAVITHHKQQCVRHRHGGGGGGGLVRPFGGARLMLRLPSTTVKRLYGIFPAAGRPALHLSAGELLRYDWIWRGLHVLCND
ncbi:MAG: hypothetical protein IPK19_13065 [Chloroflexi bacterium]|nr:hypothetical protein [Chloroflexota bacterium]